MTNLAPDSHLQPNLWHLLPLSELYKLETFLRGGLWCAESSTIVTFEGDIENKLPFGFFISCWHINPLPSQRAWEILGGNGHGIALRTSLSAIQHLADLIRVCKWDIRFQPVHYVDTTKPFTPSPFAVSRSHVHENEGRLVVHAQETKTLDHSINKLGDPFARYLARDQAARYNSISIVGPDTPEAIVLPIGPLSFIHEIQVGSLVTERERIQLQEKLNEYRLCDRLRAAQSPP